jgi:hypothetical protein
MEVVFVGPSTKPALLAHLPATDLLQLVELPDDPRAPAQRILGTLGPRRSATPAAPAVVVLACEAREQLGRVCEGIRELRRLARARSFVVVVGRECAVAASRSLLHR